MSQVWPRGEKGRGPVNFVLMLLIHDTRFWYLDLIQSQITDLWLVSSKLNNIPWCTRMFLKSVHSSKENVIIWQVKLPYWHELQDNCKLWADGQHQSKVYRLPCLFSFSATLFQLTLLADILFCPAPFGSLYAGFVGTLRLVRFHVLSLLTVYLWWIFY